MTKNRSSHLQIFFKLVVLKNFAKFAGNYRYHGLFLEKMCAYTFIKKEAPKQLVSCKSSEMMTTPFLHNTSKSKFDRFFGKYKSRNWFFRTDFKSTGFLKNKPFTRIYQGFSKYVFFYYHYWHMKI